MTPCAFSTNARSVAIGCRSLGDRSRGHSTFFTTMANLIIRNTSRRRIGLAHPFTRLGVNTASTTRTSRTKFAPMRDSMVIGGICDALGLFGKGISNPIRTACGVTTVPKGRRTFPITGTGCLSVGCLLINMGGRLITIKFAISGNSSGVAHACSGIPMRHGFHAGVCKGVLADSTSFSVRVSNKCGSSCSCGGIMSVTGTRRLGGTILRSGSVIVLKRSACGLLGSARNGALAFVNEKGPRGAVVGLHPCSNSKGCSNNLGNSGTAFRGLAVRTSPGLRRCDNFNRYRTACGGYAVGGICALCNADIFRGYAFRMAKGECGM